MIGAIRKRLAAGQYEEAAEDLMGRLASFQDLVEDHFGDHVLKGKELGGAVAVIPQLATGPVITTNFDRVLEKVFQAAGCPFQMVVWHDKIHLGVRAFEQNLPILLKIHGDWQDPSHRVLTLSEYRAHYGDPDAEIDFNLPLPQLFQLLAVRPVLFLGCSLKQDRTVAILRTVAGKLPLSRHYAVVARPKSAARSLARANDLARWNIRPIWYPDGQHEKIEGLLRYLAALVPEVHRRAPVKHAQAQRKPDTIPEPMTSFIGRAQERRELIRLLRSRRMLTITGPPGAGKTRATVKLAQDVQARFDAVWFIELSQLREQDAIPLRMANLMRLNEQPPRRLIDVIAEALMPGAQLLVFDNCEHVVAQCKAIAGELLELCPKLKILASSRAVLGLAAETVYQLPPLDIPNSAHPVGLAALKRIDSIKLLTERADTSFRLTENNAAAVVELCRGLEGIPLAIELAAAQLDTMSPADIVAHLNRRLDLLVGGAGGKVERQWATLREAIALSHGLLNQAEKVLFRRLAVFHRGWTWPAAAAICRNSDQDDFDIYALMKRLHRESLVAVNDFGGEKRFRLLDSIREFAQENLAAAGEEASITERHARWFAGLAEQAAPELLKKSQAQWLDRITADADNLRAAIQWAAERSDTELALRLTASLWRFTEIKGFYRDGSDRLRFVLAMPGGEDFPALRSKALSGLGVLAYRQGDLETAEKRARESLEIEQRLKNATGIANALNDLGNVALMKGDYESAHKYYSDCLNLERSAGNQRGIAVALFNSGNAARRLGLNVEAQARIEESLAGFEAEGNLREAAFPLNALARLALARGETDRALELADRSRAVRRALGDKRGISESLRTLAAVRIAKRQFDIAYQLLIESSELVRSMEDKRGLAETLEHFAGLAASNKQPATAVWLFASAERVREEIRLPMPPVDRSERDALFAAAQEVLGDDAYRDAWNTGARADAGEAMKAAARLGTSAAVR
jgi:predicted ATPase